MINLTVMKQYGIIFTLLCLVGFCPGCRSTHKVVENTGTEQFSGYRDQKSADTTALQQSGHIEARDSAAINVSEQATVEIRRDSAGRPTFIFWNFNYRLLGNTSWQGETGWRINGVNTAHNSETSGNTHSVAKKKKETTAEVDPAIPLESIIGTALLSLTVLYLIYLFLTKMLWPWIKQHKQ